MKITVWTLTVDGDNIPLETRVFASEEKAIEAVAGMLGVDVFPNAHLAEKEWTVATDGACIIEEHEVEVPLSGKNQ